MSNWRGRGERRTIKPLLLERLPPDLRKRSVEIDDPSRIIAGDPLPPPKVLDFDRDLVETLLDGGIDHDGVTDLLNTISSPVVEP